MRLNSIFNVKNYAYFCRFNATTRTAESKSGSVAISVTR